MRSNVVDYFRALAITLVTVYHIHMGIGNGNYALPYGFDLYAPLGNGWIGVGLFFIISGYCMGMSTAREFANDITIYKSLRYLFKRFLRIAPAYYFSIIVWFVLIKFFSITNKPTGVYDLITHVLFVHNLINDTIYTVNGVYWSIGVEMQFYLALPLITTVINTFNKKVILFAFCMISTFMTYNSEFSHAFKIGLANYLTLFVFGWMLYEYRIPVQYFLRKTKLGVICFFFAIIMLFYKGGGYSNTEKLYEVAVSILFGFSMIYFNLNRSSNSSNWIKHLISLTGRASFSIYLYNYIFYAVKPVNYNLFSGFILFLTVSSFGILMYYIVEVQTEKMRKQVFSYRVRETELLSNND